jgi:hypothetical protein
VDIAVVWSEGLHTDHFGPSGLWETRSGQFVSTSRQACQKVWVEWLEGGGSC